jgi:hypothetical protein
MVKSRKELRFYILSSLLVALVVSMTFSTFLSSTYFPSGIGPGESGTFNIVVTGPASSNAAKVTYLAQWVGVDSTGSQMLLHPTAEELQAASTTTTATTGTATTPSPSPDATGTSTTVASQ